MCVCKRACTVPTAAHMVCPTNPARPTHRHRLLMADAMTAGRNMGAQPCTHSNRSLQSCKVFLQAQV